MTKTKRIAFRVSDNDFEMIKGLSEERGMTMTDFILFAILDQTEPIDGDDVTMKGGEE